MANPSDTWIWHHLNLQIPVHIVDQEFNPWRQWQFRILVLAFNTSLGCQSHSCSHTMSMKHQQEACVESTRENSHEVKSTISMNKTPANKILYFSTSSPGFWTKGKSSACKFPPNPQRQSWLQNESIKFAQQMCLQIHVAWMFTHRNRGDFWQFPHHTRYIHRIHSFASLLKKWQDWNAQI